MDRRRNKDGGLPVRDEEKEAVKEAMCEALREWLDEKYAAFGKWSFNGLLAMALGGIVYMFLLSQGWNK